MPAIVDAVLTHPGKYAGADIAPVALSADGVYCHFHGLNPP